MTEKKNISEDAVRKDQEWNKGGRRIKLMVAAQAAIVIVVLAFLFFHFILGASKIDGDSMKPTFKNGETVWFTRLEHTWNRGDVISMKMPGGEHYVKRIVAIPGDTVDIDDGKLLINGEEVNTEGAVGKTYPEEGVVQYPYIMRKNKYFVLGDNREHSIDSRSFGAISVVQIQGKVLGQ